MNKYVMMLIIGLIFVFGCTSRTSQNTVNDIFKVYCSDERQTESIYYTFDRETSTNTLYKYNLHVDDIVFSNSHPYQCNANQEGNPYVCDGDVSADGQSIETRCVKNIDNLHSVMMIQNCNDTPENCYKKYDLYVKGYQLR